MLAGRTITSQRLNLVDFSNPLFPGVKELLVTGPSAPPVTGVDDLAAKEIQVRRSSSYYESLTQLNQSFQQTGKPKMCRVVVSIF